MSSSDSDCEMSNAQTPAASRPKRTVMRHYVPLHILFEKHHDDRLMLGKHAMIPIENLHEDGSRGGRLTYLSTAQALSAQRALKHGKRFKYHPSLGDIKFNVEAGAGWGDFTDWLSDRWEDAKTIGKEVLKYAPAILEFVSEILQPSSPQLITLKAALKVSGGFATKLDAIVNKTAVARDKAELAQTEYETSKDQSEDAALDFKLAAKDKEVSDKERARLKKLADEAKAKVLKKKELLRAKEAEAKRLEKEAAAVLAAKKKADKEADAKAKLAEKAAQDLKAKKGRE